MIAEIVIEILKNLLLALVFPSPLPFEWNFLRIKLGMNLSVIVNASSYFMNLALFSIWATLYISKEIEIFFGLSNNVNKKVKASLTGLVVMFSILLVWPRLVHVTYFLTCSYYPWAVTVVVVYATHFEVMSGSRAPLKSAQTGPGAAPDVWSTHAQHEPGIDVTFFSPQIRDDETYDERQRVEADVEQRDPMSSLYRSSRVYSLPERDRPSSMAEERSNSFLSGAELMMGDDEDASFQGYPYGKSEPFDTSFDSDRTLQHEKVYMDKTPELLGYREEGELHTYDWGPLTSTPKKRVRFLLFPEKIPSSSEEDLPEVMEAGASRSAPKSRPLKTKTIFRKSYCGKCSWSSQCCHSKISSLRLPRTTRSGKIYGPPSHIQPLHEYAEEYGL